MRSHNATQLSNNHGVKDVYKRQWYIGGVIISMVRSHRLIGPTDT